MNPTRGTNLLFAADSGDVFSTHGDADDLFPLAAEANATSWL